ncbi:MAG TPA: hypothetical protein VEJ87_06035, partial [Acidimicrobiales bacterium]|nr:hypothetical protein [Acidimicrobiales bacterium]
STSVRATVSVSSLVLRRGETLTLVATIRNEGSTPCPYVGIGSLPTREQAIGPCGVLSLEVLNLKGRDVWPGRLVFNCPLLVGAELAPGASLQAKGEWVPFSVGGRLSRGLYRIVVGGHLTFGVTLV